MYGHKNVLFKVNVYKYCELNRIIYSKFCIGKEDIRSYVDSMRLELGDKYNGYTTDVVELSQHASKVISTGIECIETIKHFKKKQNSLGANQWIQY